MLRALWYVPGLVYAVIYAVLALTAGGHVSATLAEQLFAVSLPSGTVWQVTFSHLFVVVAFIFLFFELLRSTAPTHTAVLENGVAAVSALVFLLLFILVPDFGTTEFLLATIMALLDFLAGAQTLISQAKPKAEHETEAS